MKKVQYVKDHRSFLSQIVTRKYTMFLHINLKQRNEFTWQLLDKNG